MANGSEAPTTLVTGAAGFLGRHIAHELWRAGHCLLLLDQDFASQRDEAWGETPRATFLPGKVSDVASLVDVPIDYVLHAAATTAEPEAVGTLPERHFREAITSALVLLEWAHASGAKRTILLSSAAVFGSGRSGPCKEGIPPSPDTLYGYEKHSIENLCSALAGCYRRDCLVVRLGNVYGPGEQARRTRPTTSIVHQMISSALERGSLEVNDDGHVEDWTYAPDVGRAIATLLRAPPPSHDVYNLTAGILASKLDIATAISACLPSLTITSSSQTSGGRPYGRYLVGELAEDEFGLGGWTSLEDGLTTTVEHCRTEAASL